MSVAKFPMIVEWGNGRWTWYKYVLQDYLDFWTMLDFTSNPEVINETLSERNVTRNLLMLTTQREDDGSFAHHAYNMRDIDGRWYRMDSAEPILRACDDWGETSPYLWYSTSHAFFYHLEPVAVTLSTFQQVDGISAYHLLVAKNPGKKAQIEAALEAIALQEGPDSLFYKKKYVKTAKRRHTGQKKMIGSKKQKT